jgi:hypothetical protein
MVMPCSRFQSTHLKQLISHHTTTQLLHLPLPESLTHPLIVHAPPSPAAHISLTDLSVPPSPTSTIDLCSTTQDEGMPVPQTPAATGKGKWKTKGSGSLDKAQDSNSLVAPPAAKKAKSKGKEREKPVLMVEELEEAAIHPLPTSAAVSVKAQCEGITRQRPEGDVKTTLGGFKGCLGFELRKAGQQT